MSQEQASRAVNQPLATTKMSVMIPMSTQTIRDSGPLSGDDEEYEQRTKPYRGGILSERRLHDKRTTAARLVQDSEALRHALRWTVEDLVDYKAWGKERADENARLRARIDEILSYLTDEERQRVFDRSAEARKLIPGSCPKA